MFYWTNYAPIFRVLHTSMPVLKFTYSDKVTKFWEISTLLLSYVVSVKSKEVNSQNFLAFSEYMNFIFLCYKKINLTPLHRTFTKSFILASQDRRNGRKVGWDIIIWWAKSKPPVGIGLNKVTTKRWLERFPTFPHIPSLLAFCTLLIAKIVSIKNTRTWVSMALT